MERNDIENIKSNQSKQRSYRGAKRSGRGGAHGGAPALHPSPLIARRWIGRQSLRWPRPKAIDFSWLGPELFGLLFGPPGLN